MAAGTWYFEQLVVDGSRAVRARTPNRFYDHMGETVEVLIEGQSGKFRRTTEVPVSSLELLKGLNTAELHDVTLTAFHKWRISRRFLSEVDHNAGTINIPYSIIADPMFVDPENHDYHLRPGSPALEIGFQPFDYSEAGVYGGSRLDRTGNSVEDAKT